MCRKQKLGFGAVGYFASSVGWSDPQGFLRTPVSPQGGLEGATFLAKHMAGSSKPMFGLCLLWSRSTCNRPREYAAERRGGKRKGEMGAGAQIYI